MILRFASLFQPLGLGIIKRGWVVDMAGDFFRLFKGAL
ncbi:hypothetical protein C5S29_16015 [ANME-1 cluster archaeon GoMg3.2]|nr:hypothetical protein [ANME-1 cluster archaeon GoMg3.2]